MIRGFLFPLILLLALPAFASEIDDFTDYYKPLPDSDEALDRKVNGVIDASLAKAKGCDLNSFGEAVAGELASIRLYSGAMERFAWSDPGVKRIKRKLSQSVYAGTPFSRSLIGTVYGLDPVISLSGVKMGTDKVGHFVDHGLNLFRMHKSGKTVEELALYSLEEEEGAFGLLTTGIKSYADIAADLDGLRFWQDIFGQGPGPFVQCRAGKLVKVRAFRFGDYVTAAWNEAVNCNDYDGNSLTIPSLLSVQMALEDMNHPPEACDAFYEELVRKSKGEFTRSIEENLAKLQKQTARKFRCPMEPEKCVSLRAIYEKRYGSRAASLALHPGCGAR